MVALLPSPVLQFSDSNGVPIAGGTISTFVVGTTTPVSTWSESTGTALNSNPIVLNAAGECTIYASGAVRLIVKDAVGNLIYDQPSNTLVSTAMAPVCLAADIPTALSLLGVSAAIAAGTTASAVLVAAETTRAEAAEAALSTAAAANMTSLTASLAAETAARQAADTALAASITTQLIKTGSVTTNSGGTATVTFAPAFPATCSCVILTVQGGAVGAWAEVQSVTAAGFQVTTSSPLFGSGWAGGPCSVFWLATGS